jgi:hypothetical protein
VAEAVSFSDGAIHCMQGKNSGKRMGLARVEWGGECQDSLSAWQSNPIHGVALSNDGYVYR